MKCLRAEYLHVKEMGAVATCCLIIPIILVTSMVPGIFQH